MTSLWKKNAYYFFAKPNTDFTFQIQPFTSKIRNEFDSQTVKSEYNTCKASKRDCTERIRARLRTRFSSPILVVSVSLRGRGSVIIERPRRQVVALLDLCHGSSHRQQSSAEPPRVLLPLEVSVRVFCQWLYSCCRLCSWPSAPRFGFGCCFSVSAAFCVFDFVNVVCWGCQSRG